MDKTLFSIEKILNIWSDCNYGIHTNLKNCNQNNLWRICICICIWTFTHEVRKEPINFTGKQTRIKGNLTEKSGGQETASQFQEGNKMPYASELHIVAWVVRIECKLADTPFFVLEFYRCSTRSNLSEIWNRSN